MELENYDFFMNNIWTRGFSSQMERKKGDLISHGVQVLRGFFMIPAIYSFYSGEGEQFPEGAGILRRPGGWHWC